MASELTTPVRTDPISRIVASTDNSIYQIVPAGVAVPQDAGDLSAIVAENHAGPRSPIVARGGGTGTNGQSLTDGLVVDLKQGMQRIIEIDVAARIAVVEPGVVTAALNRRLAPHGLHWAPHTSTINRATVGGMIATDAAGKGSLVHGRAHRHVTALDLCLADGTIVHLEPTDVEVAERLAHSPGSTGRLWSSLRSLPITADTTVGPTLARGWTGYGVDRFRRGDVIDPTQLVIGAEGTLGIVTRAWLRLTPLPTETTMVVARFDSFDAALVASIELAETQPTAIETLDETTLDAARASSSWAALGEEIGDDRGAVLLLEYDDRDEQGDVLRDAVTAATGCRSAAAVTDAETRAAVWRVRAEAVGLLARSVVHSTSPDGVERTARPTAMVEDCAVPVPAMPEFIAEFRRVLDDAGLEYAMFGHADVGCVHVRPALDLTDPDHERLVGSVTESVVELVRRHGGVLWGEHGRGVRGADVADLLEPDALELMRRVKTAFDPDDLCNPGKLYRPVGSSEPLTDLRDAPMRGQRDRRVPIEVRSDHHSAFACNGNGLCHDLEAAAPMCPSYQATGDPARSPNGRADLLRTWLLARHGPDDGATSTVPADELADFEDALAANLHECLSCAACSGRCPVEVDVPELKSRFLAAYHERRRRPLVDHVLGRLETAAPIAARAPRLSRVLARPAARLLGLVDLPTPPRPTPSEHPRFDPESGAFDESIATATTTPVVVIPDVFTSVFEPATLDAAIAAIGAAGHPVAVAPFVGSGKFDHVRGRRAAFEQAVARQRSLIDAVVAAGAQPVVIEPAVVLLHHHEYREIDGDHPGERVASLAEVLADAAHRLPAHPAPTDVTLLGHCTERARRPADIERWRTTLEAVGHRVEVVDVGCCGMAGIFGHERANQAMSRRLWEQNWRDPVEAAGGRAVAATGWSCRSQAARFGQRQLGHPVGLVRPAELFS